MQLSQAHLALLLAFTTLPALTLSSLVTLSTTTHTCYKTMSKTCLTAAIVQPDCDGAISAVCTQGESALNSSILYNTTQSCTASLYVGQMANMAYATCVDAFQAITTDCMLSGGSGYSDNAQGGVQNMVPLASNWQDFQQADTNKPAWQIMAAGCV